ncbi:MAG: hypothetical protein WCS37_08960 [Chloroflexota bacterium]|nr:hypothetical protein [Chloroflexota bacterium]
MSWHPYSKGKRTWTIYWEERSPKAPAEYNGNPAGAWDVLEFELTDPDVLDRDDWRSLQIWLLQQLTPPGYTLNISHLWGRNWPNDAPFRFGRLNDMHHVPVILSGDGNNKTQPGKRQDYYWVLVQTPPEDEKMKDVIFFHSIDLEDITWITPKPLTPFPDQMFLHNDTALAWNNKQLTSFELDEIVRQETWGLSVTRYGHVNLFFVRDRISREAIWDILRRGAAEYNLEIESTSFDKRPPKPSFFSGCLAAPFGLVALWLERIKDKEKTRGR